MKKAIIRKCGFCNLPGHNSVTCIKHKKAKDIKTLAIGTKKEKEELLLKLGKINNSSTTTTTTTSKTTNKTKPKSKTQENAKTPVMSASFKQMHEKRQRWKAHQNYMKVKTRLEKCKPKVY